MMDARDFFAVRIMSDWRTTIYCGIDPYEQTAGRPTLVGRLANSGLPKLTGGEPPKPLIMTRLRHLYPDYTRQTLGTYRERRDV